MNDTLFPVGSTRPTVAPEVPPEPRHKPEPDRTLLMPFAGGAEISECQQFRYSLYRRWQEGGKRLLVIGVNPSKADGSVNDNTVVRVISFARRDGFGEVWLGNITPYRSTSPKKLKDAPVCHEVNYGKLKSLADQADKIVAAWGNNIELVPDGRAVAEWLCKTYEVWCLGVTKKGHPKHPLRLAANTPYKRYCPTPEAFAHYPAVDPEKLCESETAACQELDTYEEF